MSQAGLSPKLRETLTYVGLPPLVLVLGVGSLIAGKGVAGSLLSMATFLVMGVWFGYIWGRGGAR